MINFVDPKGLLQNSNFSQAVISKGSRTIYTSGQVSIDERGEIVGAGDLAAQTRQAMLNLRLALAAAGAGFEHIVKTTTFVVGLEPSQRNHHWCEEVVLGRTQTANQCVDRRQRARAARMAD